MCVQNHRVQLLLRYQSLQLRQNQVRVWRLLRYLLHDKLSQLVENERSHKAKTEQAIFLACSVRISSSRGTTSLRNGLSDRRHPDRTGVDESQQTVIDSGRYIVVTHPGFAMHSPIDCSE